MKGEIEPYAFTGPPNECNSEGCKHDFWGAKCRSAQYVLCNIILPKVLVLSLYESQRTPPRFRAPTSVSSTPRWRPMKHILQMLIFRDQKLPDSHFRSIATDHRCYMCRYRDPRFPACPKATRDGLTKLLKVPDQSVFCTCPRSGISSFSNLTSTPASKVSAMKVFIKLLLVAERLRSDLVLPSQTCLGHRK